MKKALFLIFLLVVVLSVSGFAYYNQVYLPAQATPEPAYNTSKVRSGDITISAAGAGNVLPSEKVAIGFLIGGTLAELNVNVGDKVEAGQVLAHLDATDAQLKLRQAELALNSFYAPDTLHQAEIAVLNAKAKLDDAADGLEYLISPSVYYWETALVKAQAELDTLESSNKAVCFSNSSTSSASSTLASVRTSASISPLASSTHKCSFRQVRRLLYPCLRTFHSPSP